MGNMIGSGVFLLPASLAPYGWNAVGAWVLTIGGALVLALVLARLTAARSAKAGSGRGGGPVDFVRDAFGAVPAFLVGWVYLVSIWTAVVTIAVAAVSYLSSLVPGLSALPFGPALAAVALLWLFTLVNLRGVHSAGRVQVVTLALKVVPLLVVIVLAALALAGGKASLPPFDPAAITGNAMAGAATLTLWALLGFECASVAAARVR
ncbi:MAG: amino acid permease, partial [Croceibacterium sp.]